MGGLSLITPALSGRMKAKVRSSDGLSFANLAIDLIVELEKTGVFQQHFQWCFFFISRISFLSTFISSFSDVFSIFREAFFFREALFSKMQFGGFLFLQPELALGHSFFVILAELHAMKALFIVFCHET